MSERWPSRFENKVAPFTFSGFVHAISDTSIGALFLKRGYQLPKKGIMQVGSNVVLKDGTSVVVDINEQFRPGEQVIVYQQAPEMNIGEDDERFPFDSEENRYD